VRPIWRGIALTSGVRVYGLVLGTVLLVFTARGLGPQGRGIESLAVSWCLLLSLGQVVMHIATPEPDRSWVAPATGTPFCSSAVMFRGSGIPPGGPDRDLTHVGDWLLHLQAARHGQVGFLRDPLGVYRRTGTSTSAANRGDGVHAMRSDQLYGLECARGVGAHPKAIRRVPARAHFFGARSALEHWDFAVSRRESDARASSGERISTMQGLLMGLRHGPAIARDVMWSYARLSRQQ
jgi:hypothetical protein